MFLSRVIKIWIRLETLTANVIDTNKNAAAQYLKKPGLWYVVPSFYCLTLETGHYGITFYETLSCYRKNQGQSQSPQSHLSGLCTPAFHMIDCPLMLEV